MKIPEYIRIGGIEYEVLDNCPVLNNGENLLCGEINYRDSAISLSDIITSHQMKCVTLWHEILHGIRENNGMEIENEEEIVEMFARGIYQVLQDNGRRLFDLKEGAQDG